MKANKPLDPDSLEDAQREIREYERTTPRVVVRTHDGYIRVGRLGEVMHTRAYKAEQWSLGTGERRSVIMPERITIASNSWRPDEIEHGFPIRQLRAGDARRIDRIEERIRELQRQKYEIVQSGFERGLQLPERRLKAVGKANLAVRDKLYAKARS
jgi:hypothetical protein